MSVQSSKQLDAIAGNRLISKHEGNIRMKVGSVILLVTTMVWIIIPDLRNYYAPFSLAVATGLGTFRSGYQSL
jgi:hypothetical protein